MNPLDTRTFESCLRLRPQAHQPLVVTSPRFCLSRPGLCSITIYGVQSVASPGGEGEGEKPDHPHLPSVMSVPG